MAKKKEKSGCTPTGGDTGCCTCESVVSVDERGQMVLPKEVREKAGIKAGDKLAVISWQMGGKVCCISLIKADEMADMIKDFMGPMMAGMSKG
ncbi:MAG: HgcAB-associated protein [Thermodesulfobacteriota bacterium]